MKVCNNITDRQLFLLLLMTSLMTTRLEAAENLLVNPGFEDGVVEPWNTYGGVSTEVVRKLVGAAVPEDPIEGDFCLHLMVPAGGANFWNAGLQHTGHVFEAGKKYTLSTFLKCKEGTLRINFKPELGQDPWTGYDMQSFTMTDEWAEYSVTTPVFTKDVSPANIIFHIAYAAGDFWIDGVRFYEGDYVPPVFKERFWAAIPSPEESALLTDTRVSLSWSSGISAAQHDVYFGADRNAVENADTSDQTGIYRGPQDVNNYTPPEALDFAQTYYWRIDEVQADLTTTHKGDIWSFNKILVENADTALAILSWNIEFLGTRKSPRTQEQINAIAQRILTFDAAVLALQEIYVVSVLEDIRSQLGASWRIYHSGMENVLLYDESKVEMLSVEILNNLENPPYTRYPGANHSRPVSGVFRSVRTDADPFRVIGVHCHWADNNIRTSEGIWLRTKTIELLGNPDEPKDIVLLGDFNCGPGSPPSSSLLEGNILNLLPKENGVGTTVSGSAIDHCYVTQGAKYRLLKKSTFVIRPEHYGETSAQFYKTYSDHLPIFIDLKPEASTGFVAHWKLDETEGIVAADSVGDNDGSVVGGPVWQPSSGKINGALEFDGIDDYVSTPFVLDPALEPFSVFAWAKAGAPGQVIISQTAGTALLGRSWLCTDSSDGKFMTELSTTGRRGGGLLVSQFVITDGQWHHIGFVWDGSYRYLCVDGAEVARDTRPSSHLVSSDGGLYFGAGNSLDTATFFSGLIDDVRIYNRTLNADEIKAIMVGWAVEDFETNDFNKFPWEHEGDRHWTTISWEKHSGNYSAQAGTIDHDESAALQVRLDCISGDITFYCKISSERGCDYLTFYIDGVEKRKWSGTNDWSKVSFPVTSGTRTFEWIYSKDGSVSSGDDTAWIDDIVFPADSGPEPSPPPPTPPDGHGAVEDFETNDFKKLPWEHEGNSHWTTTSWEKHSGNYSAQAGTIDHDESTALKVTLDCISGDVSFYCKVSSESDFDYLNFYIDGVKQGEWSGEQDWVQVSFPVTTGTRTFEWTYSKDGSESVWDDTAWIDDIIFPHPL